MRILFVTPPVLAHTYPIVPTAWALRAAGHDVALATCGSMADRAARSGLVSFDTAPGQELAAIFRELYGPPGSRPPGRPSGPPRAPSGPQPNPFAILADRMLPALHKLVDDVRPDVVVHTPHGYAGAVIAGNLGVPAIVHGLGLGPDRDQIRGFYHGVADLFERHGAPMPELSHSVDVAPDSVRIGPPAGWPVRYVPYNGGGVLPEWVFARPERPRVLITLGTTVPAMVGLRELTPLWAALRAAAEVDAEFVLALGDLDTSALAELPPNVRLCGWVPLHALLATSDAVVHHGGSGTTMAVLDAGLPQLVLPQGADQFANAGAIGARGNGLVATADELDAPLLRTVLDDPVLRKIAAEVRAEMHAMPAPSALVAPIAGLLG